MPEILQNEFSWSKSRHERFGECRRAYFYTYYGSWGGWEAEPGTAVRELYVLKKLSSRWQWAGSLVHGTLKRILHSARFTGSFWPLEKALDRTHQRARTEWAASRDKSYWREPSQIVGLVEHEYGEVVQNGEWKALYEQVIEGSLRAFYRSPTLDRIRGIPREQWLSVDELDAWDFEGTKVWVAVDFAYRGADGRVCVLDWKTGKERAVDHMQLGIYALYAQQKWCAAPAEVRCGLVYLAPNGSPGGEEVSVAADPATLAVCQAKMRESIVAMRAALADPERNLADEEAFPRLAERDACRRCPFRRPCGRI
ncbi:MAG TPA: PD-(D/E)XK nuclease family protein [Anaeromyxobacter sp.]|nr:PD-(D/E)XK nuclease family protein [Anaeromyxobacter sp.]